MVEIELFEAVVRIHCHQDHDFIGFFDKDGIAGGSGPASLAVSFHQSGELHMRSGFSLSMVGEVYDLSVYGQRAGPVRAG